MVREWCKDRREVLLPQPLRHAWNLYMRLEKKIFQQLPSYSESLITGFLIIFMIVAIVLVAMMVSLELYAESMQVVQLSGKVVSNLADSTSGKTMMPSCHENYDFGACTDPVEQGHMRSSMRLTPLIGF